MGKRGEGGVNATLFRQQATCLHVQSLFIASNKVGLNSNSLVICM